MNKRIIFNCVTPFDTHLPSPALSILKSWLTKHRTSSSIVYWNLHFKKLHNDFVWNNPAILGNSHKLALPVNYIVNRADNNVLNESLKKILQGVSPRFIDDAPEFYDRHMQKYADKMDEIIDDILCRIDFSEVLCFGFSIKMDGWAMSSIIAKRIKIIAPDMLIIIGGVSTRKDAEAFLSSFLQFDIAMWGEGEGPLIELIETLKSDKRDFVNVSNIAYRDSDSSLVFSKKRNNHYLDLSTEDVFPDYDDYFVQKRELNIKQDSIIPIEGSRGCHWNRCKFCYLNTDYRYRVKSAKKICEEMRHMIERYKVYSFEFLDNDFLGLNLQAANELLDGLIAIKKDEPRLSIVTVEVITKGLDYATIQKLFKAGITYVQIGYENASNSLLGKIHKKNTFASNLFYIKVSTGCGIPMFSVNNIMNMPDETVEDIIEAADNLKFLRFFLHHLNFNHALVQLHVNSSSRYYHRIKNELNSWKLSEIAYSFIKETINEKYWWDVFSFMKETEHFQWKSFREIERFYINNPHSYRISRSDTVVGYSEYVGGRKIKERNFDVNSIEFQILHHANKKIVSLSDLQNIIHADSKTTLTEGIEELYADGLVYRAPDYEEIVAVIDVEPPLDVL